MVSLGNFMYVPVEYAVAVVVGLEPVAVGLAVELEPRVVVGPFLTAEVIVERFVVGANGKENI